MLSSETERLFRKGVAAVRAGDNVTARTTLEQVIKLNETHEEAWLWLSAVVDTVEDRITCLENVLVINPENELAQRALAKLHDSPLSDDSGPVESHEFPEPEPPGVLNLFDAWAGMLVFNTRGAVADELRQPQVIHVFINLLSIVLIQSIAWGIQLFLVQAVQGITPQEYVLDIFGSIPGGSPAALTGITTAIVITYLAIFIIGTIFGQVFASAGVHAIARGLGAQGDYLNTLHALSIATVAYIIVLLLPGLAAPFLPEIATVITLLFVSVYGIMLQISALAATHPELSKGRSCLVFLIGYGLLLISLVAIFACFSYLLLEL